MLLASLLCVGLLSCSKEDAPLEPSQQTDEQITFRSNFNLPTVQSGMLKFSNRDHLLSFYDFMDAEQKAYTEKSGDANLTEPMLDRLESQLGFQSLRSLYNVLEDQNQNYYKNLNVYIDHPYMQTVFNRQNEVMVGNKYYKFIDNGHYIEAQNMSQIIAMRGGVYELGVIIRDIDYYPGDGGPLTGGPTITFRHECQQSIRRHNADVLNLTESINIRLINLDGFEVTEHCTGNITIDWGDGHVDRLTGLHDPLRIRSHTYSVPSGCRTFTIKYTFQGQDCGSCGAGGSDPNPITSTLTIRKCDDSEVCIENGSWKYDRYWLKNLNDDRNQVRAKKKYKTSRTFFHLAEAFGEMTFFRKEGNEWKKSRPGFGMYINIHGAVFDEDCDGSRINVNLQGGTRGSKIKMRATWGDDIASSVTEGCLIDFEVNHLVSRTIGADVSLLNNDMFFDKEPKR